MALDSEPLTIAAVAGLAGGLGLLIRGLGAYRTSNRIADTSSATIRSVAAGEALVTGTVEAAEVLLTSPLQSRPCVYYRATVTEFTGDTTRTVLSESRAVGFRIRDASGAIRVLPRGAWWLVPDRYHEHTSMLGDEPAGLDLRTGGAIEPAVMDRDAAVARLLTVHEAPVRDDGPSAYGASGRHEYREARLESGDVITVVGYVSPYEQVPEAATAGDAWYDATAGDPLADPAIAADIAEARRSGDLAGSPEDAWGNAAIPGFGIGRPARAPDIDPDADPLPIAPTDAAARAATIFDIAPTDLVLVGTPDVPLLVTVGAPAQAAAREQGRFLLGLVGAVVAIAAAMSLAISLTGGKLP